MAKKLLTHTQRPCRGLHHPLEIQALNTSTRIFDVRGVLSLIILYPDGKTVTKQGANLINQYQENACPFTETELGMLNGKEAESLPKSILHKLHQHKLTLVSGGTGGGPFVCCNCIVLGSVWAYQCIDCGYEVHPGV